MERREAQRPTSLAARTPKAATPGDGDIAVGAQGGPQGSPGRPRQPAEGAAIRPGASRRSIPSSGKRKKGKTGRTSLNNRRAKRWLLSPRHSGARAKRANPESITTAAEYGMTKTERTKGYTRFTKPAIAERRAHRPLSGAALVVERINAATSPDILEAIAPAVWDGWGKGEFNDAEAVYLTDAIDRRRPVTFHRSSDSGVGGPSRPLGRLVGRLGSRLGSRFIPRRPQRSKNREASRHRRRMLGGSAVLPIIFGIITPKASARCCASWPGKSNITASAICPSTRLLPSRASVGPWCRTPCTRRVGSVTSRSPSVRSLGARTCPT